MRALISGREDALEVSSQAFALLYAVAGRRLAAGRTVVVDSCALSPQAREDLAALAQDHKVSAHLLLLEGSRQLCLEGQRVRDRKVPVEAVEHHLAQQDELIKSIERRALGAEGFSSVIRLGRRAASAVERIDIV
jgi:protein phosphatase